MIFLICFMATLFSCGYSEITEEKSIVVVIPSYKNINWYQQNITSVLTQNYSNFKVIYVDDFSPDGTAAAVEKFIKPFKKKTNFKLIKNKTRLGALENIYNAIQLCDPNDIIVLIDGDDWLPNPHVLSDINAIYSTKEVWFTHGKLIEYPYGHSSWCIPITAEAIENNTYRKYRCPSHLRTFYVWLFNEIKKEDLMYNGKFFPMTWDMAIMFPIAEMAAERHHFFEEVNYVYNMANSINDNKVDPELQNQLDTYIRAMPPYKRLEAKPERNITPH